MTAKIRRRTTNTVSPKTPSFPVDMRFRDYALIMTMSVPERVGPRSAAAAWCVMHVDVPRGGARPPDLLRSWRAFEVAAAEVAIDELIEMTAPNPPVLGKDSGKSRQGTQNAVFSTSSTVKPGGRASRAVWALG